MYKCYFIVFVLIASPPAIITDDCDGWKAYEGMCYYFSNETMELSRDEANSWCEKNTGVLATISNVNINNYTYGQIERKGFHWIGLSSNDGSQRNAWRWLDGAMVDLRVGHDFYWGSGEPSGESTVCGKLGVNNEKKLANTDCDNSLRFICESDKRVDEWVSNNNGHWYHFTMSNFKNFKQAMDECSQFGAYLARIGDISELTFIQSNMVGNNEYWIGLTTLYWLDGSPINWLNIKEIKNINKHKSCVYFHSDENKWEATVSDDCNRQLKFICQKAKITTTTSTITTPSISKPFTALTSTNLETIHSSSGESSTNDDLLISTEVLPFVSTGNGQTGTDLPMVAGVVAGIVVVIIVVIIAVLLLYRRRKRSNSKAQKPNADGNFNAASTDHDIDIQPYGTSGIMDTDIQAYGTSDFKTIEDNNCNHKYESESISPYYNAVTLKDGERAFASRNAQQMPVYAVVDKPKVTSGTTNIENVSEHETQSGTTGKQVNINSMPVYAVVDVAKKKATHFKEKILKKQQDKSTEEENKPVVEASKDYKSADNNLPVYAVVDKTNRHERKVQKHIKGTQHQQEKLIINHINTSNNAPVYAVVDTTKKVQSSKPIPPAKPSTKLTQNTDVDGMISAHIYNDCENVDELGSGPPQIQYAELDIQEETGEANKLSLDAGHEYAEVQFKD